MQTVCANKGSCEFISALIGISQAEEHFPRCAALQGWPQGRAGPHAQGLGSVEEPQALRRDGSRLAEPQEVSGPSGAGAGYTQPAGAKVQATNAEGVTNARRDGVVVGMGLDK